MGLLVVNIIVFLLSQPHDHSMMEMIFRGIDTLVTEWLGISRSFSCCSALDRFIIVWLLALDAPPT